MSADVFFHNLKQNAPNWTVDRTLPLAVLLQDPQLVDLRARAEVKKQTSVRLPDGQAFVNGDGTLRPKANLTSVPPNYFLCTPRKILMRDCVGLAQLFSAIPAPFEYTIQPDMSRLRAIHPKYQEFFYCSMNVVSELVDGSTLYANITNLPLALSTIEATSEYVRWMMTQK